MARPAEGLVVPMPTLPAAVTTNGALGEVPTCRRATGRVVPIPTLPEVSQIPEPGKLALEEKVVARVLNVQPPGIISASERVAKTDSSLSSNLSTLRLFTLVVEVMAKGAVPTAKVLVNWLFMESVVTPERAPEVVTFNPEEAKAKVPEVLPRVTLPEVLARLISPVEAVKLLFTVKSLTVMLTLVAVRVPVMVMLSVVASPNQAEPSTSRFPAT